MNVLMISLDNNLLVKNSSSQLRHFKFGKICDNLEILVLHNGEPYEFENVRIYPVKGNKFKRLTNAYKKGIFLIKHKKIDLITTQDPSFCGLIGFLLKKKEGVKLNLQIHGMEEKLLNKILFFPLKKIIIKNADSIRVVSERLKKWIKSKYKIDEGKIFNFHIYSDMVERLKNLKIKTKDSNEFTILTVGRLVKVKNIGLQIKALKEVLKKFPNAYLIIVGDGPEKNRLEKISKKLKIEKNIKFLGSGFKNDFDLARYYKSADLFLLTSNHEGFGMVALEAVIAGCPIIMTDVGCAGDIVKNGENGIVIPVEDKEALINAIKYMISNEESRMKFIEKGKEIISKLPNEQETLAMYKKMWEGEN